MSVEKLARKNEINIKDLQFDQKDSREYTHSFDLFIENASETNIAVSELKAEFFTSEEDYPTHPKKVHEWPQKVNLSPGEEAKIGSITVLSTSRDQFLWIRWTPKLEDMRLIPKIIDLRDERNNPREGHKFKGKDTPQLPITRSF